MAEKIEKTLSLKTIQAIKKNIFLYIAGNATSRFGTYMYNFAIGLYVLKLTGSGSSFALAILFGMLPRVILSPFAGVFADRFDRKKMVVLMDFLSGLLLLVVFMIAKMMTLSLPIIYASSAMLTICNTFFSMALGASIPNLVDDTRLMKLNSMGASIDSLASLGGPIIGGVIYALIGFEYFLILNGISFIISGVTEMFMNFNVNDLPPRPKDTSKDIFASMKEGFKYLEQHKLIMGIFKYVLFINFIATGISILLPYMSVEVLQASSVEYGVVQAGFPVGILVMSILFSLLKKEDNKIFKRLARDLFLFGICFALFGLPTSPLLQSQPKLVNLGIIFGVSVLLGFIVIMINIPIQTMLQRAIVDEYRGRVNGVVSTLSQLVTPLGIICFGFLVDHVDTYVLPIVSGILIMLIALLMLRDKKMLKL